MTLNPFSLLKELITEHGSAVIFKERLTQAAEQYALLEKQLAEKKLELADSRAIASQLETQNQQLKLEVDQQQRQITKLKELQQQSLAKHYTVLWDTDLNPHCPACKTLLSVLEDTHYSRCPGCHEHFGFRKSTELLALAEARLLLTKKPDEPCDEPQPVHLV